MAVSLARWGGALSLAGALCLAPGSAAAFCGFYVSGADAKLFNNATVVVLMREGTRTVLSMQNNYQGPPEDFAVVVPVPVVLQKDQVKTLPRDIFDKVDQLGAPRLVEYWEMDPCLQPKYETREFAMSAPVPMADEGSPKSGGLGVRVEARFEVGEYEVVILSARDALGLDTWLRNERYRIPAGAEPYLRPYVQSGSKFFVARVNARKVRFENGQAALSPLRFHYDSESFSLPIRLGLINSSGTQDLIVNVLAHGQRFEVANYDNVAIPTNLDVVEGVRDRFGEFYAALFDRTVARHPRAVVTEYAWDSGTCDPCPTPPLEGSDLWTLGADVLPSTSQRGGDSVAYGSDFVLTRLHARYTKSALGDDLVFKTAPAIAGGREHLVDGKGLERGARPSSDNNFQARYAIRHPWTGPVACKDPVYGRWGDPPSTDEGRRAGRGTTPKAAKNIAFAPRGKLELASFLAKAAPAPDVLSTFGGGITNPSVAGDVPAAAPVTSAQPQKRGGCAGCALGPLADGSRSVAALTWMGALGFAVRSRRRRSRSANIRR